MENHELDEIQTLNKLIDSNTKSAKSVVRAPMNTTCYFTAARNSLNQNKVRYSIFPTDKDFIKICDNRSVTLQDRD